MKTKVWITKKILRKFGWKNDELEDLNIEKSLASCTVVDFLRLKGVLRKKGECNGMQKYKFCSENLALQDEQGCTVADFDGNCFANPALKNKEQVYEIGKMIAKLLNKEVGEL